MPFRAARSSAEHSNRPLTERAGLLWELRGAISIFRRGPSKVRLTSGDVTQLQ